ncbi:MAG: NAD(P)H-hydrate epimerase [Planctomycetota bacterium]|nr:NAD(P)H-hydrate epimerase [Planctomycetota bacterium]
MTTEEGHEIAHLSTPQMVEVDRAMTDGLHINLIQMMENAGRNLAHLARVRFLDGDPRGKRVVVLAGTGGNGGGAMVSARRLHTWGARVQVIVTRSLEDDGSVPAHQYDILQRMGVFVATTGTLGEVGESDLILDGVIGYGLRGAPEGPAAEEIRWANGQEVPILSLDVPSGIDASTGGASDPSIRATATMTLALPKEGFFDKGNEKHVGELYLADISVPPSLYAGAGIGVEVGPIFSREEIIRLR